jgi:HEAT repeat protein
MSLLNLGEPSPAWPYIKAIAKYFTIPGTDLGLGPLADLQDELAQDQYEDQVKALLQAMSTNTAQILAVLQKETALSPTEPELRAAALDFAEWLYLKRTADKYFYADFKGIQESKFVPLPLDDIFVDLKAVPEERESSRRDKERELREALDNADGSRRAELLAALEETDSKHELLDGGDRAQTPGQMLKNPGPVVLLGGPGSGKTTLVKRLARSCALGATQLRARFPDLSWCFPIVVPITQYVDGARGRTILEYVEDQMRDRGGEALLARFREHSLNGRMLLLLDGLDEVADAGARIGAAKAVDEAAQSLGRNRLLATSRRVGYAICHLSVPAAHFFLCPFSPTDIGTFVEHWYLAYEQSCKGDKADLPAARQTARELNDEVKSNSSVASLATNPLMLTIIALIKHRSVALPHRRVELYRIALETLLESWNLARSLAQTRQQRAIADPPRIEQAREVWSHIAFWMHSEANREVSRERLHNKLVEVLVAEYEKSDYDAQAIAGSYLDTAAETSGLLEARGASTFAFVHQSFQEYLAGYRLVRPASKAAARIKERCHDTRWHEVIRLGIGHLSITVGEREVVADIINDLLNSDDPLEPYLCNALRLALGCLADQVGLRQQQVDAILLAWARKVVGQAYSPALGGLHDAVEWVKAPPSPAAHDGLLQVAFDPYLPREICCEAVRLVGLAPRVEAHTLERIAKLFTMSCQLDFDMQSTAAWELWRHGCKSEPLAKAVVQAICSGIVEVPKLLTDDFATEVITLLEVVDSHTRLLAAEVLGKWGQLATALPSLRELLTHTEAWVRLQSTKVLGQWGQQETALPTLLELLTDKDAWVRVRAVKILGRWGRQKTALPVLLELLTHAEGELRLQAASVLGQWGQQPIALPTLLELLTHSQAEVRLKAVEVLGEWGQQQTALSALLERLTDTNVWIRLRVAKVLGEWGQQQTTLSTLLELLAHTDARARIETAAILGRWRKQHAALQPLIELLAHAEVEVRLWATRVLGQWEPQPTALPPLLSLLGDTDVRVRRGAAEVLGQWGRKEKLAGTHMIPELVLRELTGSANTALLAIFQNHNEPGAGFSNPAVRAEFACLVAPQLKDSPREESLRDALFRLVWHHCATTA